MYVDYTMVAAWVHQRQGHKYSELVENSIKTARRVIKAKSDRYSGVSKFPADSDS